MNTTFINWIAAAGIAAVLSGAYVILDGPSDAELAKDQAADLQDAKDQAVRQAILQSRCEALRGPRAELVMIRDSDDYVCRAPNQIY